MIRRAVQADLDQVLRIERAAFTAPHWPWESYEEMLEDGEHVQRVLLVDALDDEVRGFAGGSLVGGVAQLESIAVSDAARRQGLGRELCTAFVEWASMHGAESVELEVRASSEGVQRLYASLGFVAAGRRLRYYSNPLEDGVLMRLPLAQKTNVPDARDDRGPHV